MAHQGRNDAPAAQVIESEEAQKTLRSVQSELAKDALIVEAEMEKSVKQGFECARSSELEGRLLVTVD